MLLETLVSSAGGLLSGLVPAGVGMFKNWQQHRQELTMLKTQSEIQARLGAQRLDEVQINADANALAAAYQHDTAGIDRAPTWAVAIRILQRPALSWAIVGIFIWSAAYCLLASIISPEDIFNRTAHFANYVLVFYFTAREMRKQSGEK